MEAMTRAVPVWPALATIVEHYSERNKETDIFQPLSADVGHQIEESP